MPVGYTFKGQKLKDRIRVSVEQSAGRLTEAWKEDSQRHNKRERNERQ